MSVTLDWSTYLSERTATVKQNNARFDQKCVIKFSITNSLIFYDSDYVYYAN